MSRRSSRGLTLLEIMVAIGILAMVSVLIYGAFDGLAKSRTGLARINDRYHTGRTAMRRLSQEIASAYLSMHQTFNTAIIARKTIFAVRDSSPADRLDMTTFSHRRVVANARESDQNELSYFSCPDPLVSGKIDLCRREQNIVDFEPQKGGTVYVAVEDIDLFDIKLLDPVSGLWNDSWDTTQAIGQFNRLPLQARITLVLRGGPAGKTIKLEEKVPLGIPDPISFATPR